MKVALNLLVKDETDCLDKCLESAKGLVDEIVVGYTDKNRPETERIMKKHGVRVVNINPKPDSEKDEPWSINFAHARNALQDATKADIIFWVDSDDIIQLNEGVKRSEFLFKVKKTFGSSDSLGSLWATYFYDFDKSGNCINTVERERIYRKNYYKWIGILHEVCIPSVGMGWARQDLFTIKHNTTPERIAASGKRNLDMSLAIYDKEKKDKNLTRRSVMNIANSLYVYPTIEYKGQIVRGMDAATPLYMEALVLSEVDADKCEILLRLGEIYRKSRMVNDALTVDCEVIKLKPHWPDGYIGMGKTYQMLDRYEEAIASYSTSLTKEPNPELLGQDPTNYNIRVFKALAYCYFLSANSDKSLEYIKKSLGVNKYDQDMLQLQTIVSDAMKKQKITENIIEIKDILEKDGEKEKIKFLSQMIPSWMEDEPFAVRLKNEFNPKFEKNKMVIYCGETVQAWSPNSIKYGVGGSEEMVIYLAQALAKLGWNITVYCSCDAPGNHSGVSYKEYWAYVPEIKSDVFIAWRNEDFIELAENSGKKYLWLHDVKEDKNWKPYLNAKIDKVLFLSKFHRSLLTLIPDEKAIITRNSICPEQFAQFDGIKRITNRCVFISSPVRGLSILLDSWKEIKEAIPDATLQIFYGFEAWDAQYGNNSLWLKRKEDILERIKSLIPLGVQYIGKVGHLELAQALSAADYWTNPNFVFDEISCISAMKAQACGCWPISAGRGALSETIHSGMVIEKPEDFTKAAIATMKRGITTDERVDMKNEARKLFAVETLAKEWNDMLGGVK